MRIDENPYHFFLKHFRSAEGIGVAFLQSLMFLSNLHVDLRRKNDCELLRSCRLVIAGLATVENDGDIEVEVAKF